MNQSLTPAIEAVIPIARATGLFSSLATFQAPTGVNDLGIQLDSWADVSGLVNIPCTAPPASDARILASERRAPSEITATELLHVLLDGWYPTVAAGWRGEPDGGAWRMLVDGTAYDIAGVEADSQKQMTRIEARLSTI